MANIKPISESYGYKDLKHLVKNNIDTTRVLISYDKSEPDKFAAEKGLYLMSKLLEIEDSGGVVSRNHGYPLGFYSYSNNSSAFFNYKIPMLDCRYTFYLEFIGFIAYCIYFKRVEYFMDIDFIRFFDKSLIIDSIGPACEVLHNEFQLCCHESKYKKKVRNFR